MGVRKTFIRSTALPFLQPFEPGRASLGAVAAAFALACVPAAAATTTYTYLEIGGGAVYANAINRDGTVAGTLFPGPFGQYHGFTWRNGTLTDLGPGTGGPEYVSAADGINDKDVVVGFMGVDLYEPPHAFARPREKLRDMGTGFGTGSKSNARDINNKGEIVGARGSEQAAPENAFIYRDRQFIDLGTLGGSSDIPFGTNSVAYAINNKSQVVGSALPPTYPLHAFIWQDGVMQDLGTLGGNQEATEARAINEAGHVAGSSPNAAGSIRAFLWINGKMRNLGTLGGRYSYAYGMNDRGQVVGLSATPNSPPLNAGRAFVWQGGQMVDLNTVVTNLPRDVTLENAAAINDKGVIVGNTCIQFCEPGKDSPARAFVLIPN
jgi:probable HAF family extracellular repeat protein